MIIISVQFLYNIQIINCHSYQISISISSAFINFHWYLKGSNTNTETAIHEIYKSEVSNKLILKILHFTFLMTWLILEI